MNYKILGTVSQVLECRLEAGEQMTCKEGAVAWITPGIELMPYAAIGGKNSSNSKWQQSLCTSRVAGSMVTFRTENSGEILMLTLEQNEVVAYQKAFLAGSLSIRAEEIPREKIENGKALDDLQIFSGKGNIFFEASGSLISYELAASEIMYTDPGLFICADKTVTLNLVPNRHVMAGGLIDENQKFNLTLTGPGKVYFQTNK